MMTEKQKMLSGELYDASDGQLVAERKHARIQLREFNSESEEEKEKRQQVLKELIPQAGNNLEIQPPFYCDYGYNISIGDDVYFNFNCTILDVVPVKIGSRTLLGPNVGIYTATHPMDFKLRATGLESGKPISIGDDVWIGGDVTICPGVEIGDRTIIGAGSVVIKDIPSGVLAAGNPCRVIKHLS